MRQSLPFPRGRRRAALIAAIAIAGPIALAPGPVSAEGLFDFFFGGAKQQRPAAPQANFFADPFGTNPQAPPPRRGRKLRPLLLRAKLRRQVFSADARPAPRRSQMCQAFCPASPTKVFFGSSIDSAYSSTGERYADSENAYAYRKALRADCTCNGRDPAGLAPVDLTLDTSLRPGDVIATTNGLVAYSGSRVGNDQTAEFTPVASYPGLTAEVRARLGEMKVAPVSAEITATDAPASLINPSIAPATTGSVPRRRRRGTSARK